MDKKIHGAGTEASAVGSSDSASTLREQRLVRFPSGNGFGKECTRASPSGQVQEAANLGTAMQNAAAFNASMLQQRESSTGGYRSADTVLSGWAGNNGGPVRFFSGEWPHGYNLEWDGKHHPVQPASQGVASFAPGVPVLTSYNNTTAAPTPISSWSPTSAPWVTTTPWASNMGHVPNPHETRVAQQPLAVQSTLGKRQGLSFGGNSPAKTLRTDMEVSKNSNLRSSWPMLQGRNQSTAEVHTSSSVKQELFHPKLEPSSAGCEPKLTFMSRLFHNAAAAPGPVPFPVTIWSTGAQFSLALSASSVSSRESGTSWIKGTGAEVHFRLWLPRFVATSCTDKRCTFCLLKY